MEFIGSFGTNARVRLVPFVFSTTDTSVITISSSEMVVRPSSDDFTLKRAGSTSVISDGTFIDPGLANWTDADESGSTSSWTSNQLALAGTRYARAKRRQQISAASGDHGIQLNVTRGRPYLRIGSSAGGDDYINELSLKPGYYSMGVTSTGDFYIELGSNTDYQSLVNSIVVESSGDMAIPTTWSVGDLANLRWIQSGNAIYLSAYANSTGVRPKQIFRHDKNSWSLVDYAPEDGPFGVINVSNKRLIPSALKGDISLAADQPFFKSGHVGQLFKITSVGQKVEVAVSGADEYSNSIRVSGVGEARAFVVTASSATSNAKPQLQRAIGEDSGHTLVSGLSFAASTSITYQDGLDNQIAFYRIGVPSSDYTSGNAAANLDYDSGGLTGIAEVTAVASATESSAIVLTDFGSTAASELWEEGDWSTLKGFPSAVTLHEGRLWWAGKSKVWGSVSDSYESFDDTIEDDSGPINRIFGEGPVDTIEWMLSGTRLLIGTQNDEEQAKTSSLEEPLTPSNFVLRQISTEGSANVQAVKVNNRVYFPQTGGVRVYEMAIPRAGLDFNTTDVSILVPEIGEPGIQRAAVQKQPDKRLHFVRTDGTVAMYLTDPAENVSCWVDIETEGEVEDVAVLPRRDTEDQVYYLVKRTIDSTEVRYLEKWAQESEARGGAANKMADSFLVQNSSATTVISGLDHLVGSSVVVWGATDDLGSYTVDSTGQVTASQASTTFVVGLPYEALFQSAKLAWAADSGTALTQTKRLSHLGLILADVHARGLEFGASTGILDPLPRIEQSAYVSTGLVSSAYDNDPIEFPGIWDTDSRMVLRGQAPRPCTVLGAVIEIETRSK